MSYLDNVNDELLLQPRAVRQQRLQEGHRFTYVCEVCSRSPEHAAASDRRRTELARLRLSMLGPHESPQAAIAKGERQRFHSLCLVAPLCTSQCYISMRFHMSGLMASGMCATAEKLWNLLGEEGIADTAMRGAAAFSVLAATQQDPQFVASRRLWIQRARDALRPMRYRTDGAYHVLQRTLAKEIAAT